MGNPRSLSNTMKKCPKCQADYFDETLDFCLEDGSKLNFADGRTTAKTEVLTADQKSVETLSFNEQSKIPDTIEVGKNAVVNKSATDEIKTTSLKEKTVEKGHQVLEISVLVFALAHNWLQWLYVDRQNYGSVYNFLFSVEFIVWLLLLLAGTAAGLLTLKLGRKKGFAYIGLVILAINFLLLIVPKK